MNREIKFRVWDRLNQIWVLSTYPSFDSNFNLIIPDGFHNPKDCVIQQYTGLKDKNGREIYEGDIVRFYYGYDDQEWIYNEIKFGKMIDCRWGFYIDKYLAASTVEAFEKSEIIGNIFEKSELLK